MGRTSRPKSTFAGVEVWAEEMLAAMAKQREIDASPERAKEDLRLNCLLGS
jgi:hypothetical protein